MGCDCGYSSAQVRQNIERIIFLICIASIRTVMRLSLLSKTGSMLVRPLISPLDRSSFSSSGVGVGNDQMQTPTTSSTFTLTLKRSGRVLRKIEGSPPSFARDWTLPSHQDANNNLIVGLNVRYNPYPHQRDYYKTLIDQEKDCRDASYSATPCSLDNSWSVRTRLLEALPVVLGP